MEQDTQENEHELEVADMEALFHPVLSLQR